MAHIRTTKGRLTVRPAEHEIKGHTLCVRNFAFPRLRLRKGADTLFMIQYIHEKTLIICKASNGFVRTNPKIGNFVLIGSVLLPLKIYLVNSIKFSVATLDFYKKCLIK
jgi:hypothetical protein